MTPQNEELEKLKARFIDQEGLAWSTKTVKLAIDSAFAIGLSSQQSAHAEEMRKLKERIASLSILRYMGTPETSMMPQDAHGSPHQKLMDGSRNRALDAAELLLNPLGKHSTEDAVAMVRPPFLTDIV